MTDGASDTAGDDVDGIVAAWQRERPDLDASPLHVLSRVSRLAGVLELRRKRIFAHHLLRPYEFDVLAALRRSGDPYELTPGQLITQTHVTSGTMTNRLDVLVDRGLVRRLPDPVDGRVTRVRLAAAGRERVDAAITDLLAVEAALLAALPTGQRRDLAAALQTMLDGAPASDRIVDTGDRETAADAADPASEPAVPATDTADAASEPAGPASEQATRAGRVTRST